MIPALKKDTDATSFAINDKPIRYIGYTILFVTLGIFGGWSFFAPIDSSVLAPGTITVKSHRKTVDSLEGGIVSKINVKEGDLVKTGDILIKLDDTQIKAEMDMLRGQFISLSAFNARLTAERDKRNAIKFSDELMAMDDARVQEAIKGQEDIFATRKNSVYGEINVLQQRIQQLNSRIVGLRAQQVSKNQLRQSYAKEVRDLKELLAEGFVDKHRLNDMERTYTQLTGDIAQLSADTASAQMQIGEARIQILQTERKFQEDVARQLEEVNQRFFETTEKLHAITDRENRRNIIAPTSGIVFNLMAHTIGGVIAPGRPILEIVPENEELIIHAQVATVDIDKVKVGLTSEIRFSAFKSKTTPTMEGVVRKVSADSLINEATRMPYYLAVVEINKASYANLKKEKLVLVPGMPADVLIKTGERTLFQYLVQPLTDAFARSLIEE